MNSEEQAKKIQRIMDLMVDSLDTHEKNTGEEFLSSEIVTALELFKSISMDVVKKEVEAI